MVCPSLCQQMPPGTATPGFRAGLRTVGLAYVDPGARVLRTVEFTDDDHFNHLESALVQLGVRECAVVKVRMALWVGAEGFESDAPAARFSRRFLVLLMQAAVRYAHRRLARPPDMVPKFQPPPIRQDTASEAGQPGAQSLDLHRAMDVLARTGAAPAPRPRASFSARNLDQDLQRLLLPGTLEQHRHVLEGHHASAALAGVLAFGELLADGSGHGKYGLDRLDLGKFMRMDAAAQVGGRCGW